jgi:hypothetical protein
LRWPFWSSALVSLHCSRQAFESDEQPCEPAAHLISLTPVCQMARPRPPDDDEPSWLGGPDPFGSGPFSANFTFAMIQSKTPTLPPALSDPDTITPASKFPRGLHVRTCRSTVTGGT